MKTERWDAQGHPILPFLEMIKYYTGDEKSQSVIRCNPPCRYKVIPMLIIEITKTYDGEIIFYRLWPNGQYRTIIPITSKGLEALRRLYKNKKSKWKVSRRCADVIFTLPGRVVVADWMEKGPQWGVL